VLPRHKVDVLHNHVFSALTEFIGDERLEALHGYPAKIEQWSDSFLLNRMGMEPTSGLEPLTCRLRNNHAHSGCIFFNHIARAQRGKSGWFGHTWRRFGQQMGNSGDPFN